MPLRLHSVQNARDADLFAGWDGHVLVECHLLSKKRVVKLAPNL